MNKHLPVLLAIVIIWILAWLLSARRAHLDRKRHSEEYRKKLSDPRWFEFREKAFRMFGRECSQLGFHWGPIQLNHLSYLPGREPWDEEYLRRGLVDVRCRRHHRSFHGI